MVADGIVLSLVVGFLRKGNLSGLATLKLRWGWVFPLLLVFQFIIFSLQNDVKWIGHASGYIYIGVYIIGLFFLYLNKNNKGFTTIFIGVFLNFLAIALNGGRMPVSLEAATILDPIFIDMLQNELYAKHAAITEATRLAFLGDIIPLADPYPRTQVISIGDVIMNIGIFIFIQHLMTDHLKVQQGNETSLSMEGGETK